MLSACLPVEADLLGDVLGNAQGLHACTQGRLTQCDASLQCLFCQRVSSTSLQMHLAAKALMTLAYDTQLRVIGMTGCVFPMACIL